MSPNWRILIVDDDVDFCASLQDILESACYQIGVAHTIQQATQITLEFEPHVILIDIKLGQENGLDLLTKLPSNQSVLYVIMTAYADLDLTIQALKMGVYDFLSKPLYPQELLATLDRCFEKIRLVQENERALAALKENEAQLRQAQKMEAVGRLAGGVAHDFNNILTVILGNCHLMLNEIGDTHPLRDDLEQILKSVNRGSSLIRQLLAFSRQQVLQAHVLNLNEIIENSEKLLRRLIGENIQFTVDLDDNLSWVKVDPGQVEQVIMNLVINARDAMPKGGSLTIETQNVYFKEALDNQKAGIYASMVVRDNGSGMDEKTQSRIFDPFFTTKETGEGTGLGLATVHGIVTQSSGHIEVESEPGQGSCFKIYFPAVAEKSPAVIMKNENVAYQTGSGTVLLVEDDDALRRLVDRVLTKNGYHILSTPDPNEALHLSHNHHSPIDLLLTDVVMPTMSGRELAEHLLPIFPQLKVIYMSGHTRDQLDVSELEEADAPFLRKPFAPEVLIRKIHETLDK